ncbi:MAG: DUF1670 domain-containing protein [Candidatus Marinimicrobia bacterium]|nr:DUF1670 domain-containing protein [Candidatus Neomarinimicrobiota bacterium]MCF7841088.1 DUF1670 domain-containing protein [Candidatus Neomarinimicrobiota bacterium]
MLHTGKSLYDRSLEKTQEQVFINSLRQEFELSPAESQGVLDLAERCLYGEAPSKVGVIKFICASQTAKHGKPLKDQDLLEVSFTLDRGIDDLNVLRDQGSEALRQLKILRLTEEAYDQGGLLTQEDLGRLLQVSSRTIRKDMQALQQDGNTLHTRGNDHDIGPGVSHKTHIIDLYLSGLTYYEIMGKTRHSSHAIKRYVSTFGRMLIMLNKGLDKVPEISRLLGCSERLTKEYLALYEKHKQGDHWPSIYIELIDQLQVMYPAKKKTGVQP